METGARPPVPALPGRLPAGFDGPRACGPYDLAGTLDLINLVFRTQPATGSPRAPNMGWDYTHIYNPDNLDNVRIVCHRGRAVSSVGIYSTTVHTPRGTIAVGGINAVATHPDHRRLGLGTLTLQDAHATMRAAGLHVGLLGTGIPNYYRKVGWERAGQQRTFTFDRRNVTYLPAATELETTDDWRPHLNEMCALHNTSGLGAARTQAGFARLIERKVDRVFVGLRDGAVAAYAALRHTSLQEYAGETGAVAALLGRVFAVVQDLAERTTDRPRGQAGQFEMTVITPVRATEAGLPALLLSLGIPSALTYLGMIAILDASQLFAALGIEAGIERRGEKWRLRYGDGTLDVTEGELVKIVFGPERRPDLAAGAFPIEFFQWPIDRV